MTREEPTVSFVSSVSDLLMMVAPIAGQYVGPLYQQPSLMAVDEEVRPTIKADIINMHNGFTPVYQILHFLMEIYCNVESQSCNVYFVVKVG